MYIMYMQNVRVKIPLQHCLERKLLYYFYNKDYCQIVMFSILFCVDAFGEPEN